MTVSGLLTLFLAIAIDTEFYSTTHPVTWGTLFTAPVITPLNNLKYNMQSSNLALHGVHPRYQHALINLPQLIGPVFALLLYRPQFSPRTWSAISGVTVLSIFQHQEARFLLPAIPLLLSSVRLPESRSPKKVWIGVWMAFNVIMGLLMGRYHQGGIVPTQFHLAGVEDATNAVWWKTYSPPIWLLNGKNEQLTTIDLMGIKGDDMIRELKALAPCITADYPSKSELAEVNGKVDVNGTYLVAPLSATFLNTYLALDRHRKPEDEELRFEKVWQYRAHLNLDDLDFGDDGVWPTLQRVVGRRGLGLWRVGRVCEAGT